MNKKFREFLEELFGGKQYSYIYDTTDNMIYFNPQEVLGDCGYTNQGITDKVTKLPQQGKKKFTNNMLNSNTF